MDLAFAIGAILALNIVVFLAGCILAAYRTWAHSGRIRHHREETNGGVSH